MKEVDLFKLAKEALNYALKHGAEQVDVFISRSHSMEVEIEKSGIKTCSIRHNHGIGIRAYYKGGLGFSTSQNLSLESIREAAKKAAKQARNTEPDPDFVSLPEPKKVPPVSGLYDNNIAEITIDKIISLTKELISSCKEVYERVIVNGEVSCSSREYVIMNSLGVEVFEKKTGISAYAFCIIKRDNDVGSYYDFDASHTLKDLNVNEVGKNACKGALEFLGAKKIETKTMDIILYFLPAGSFIEAIMDAANAESVQRKRSYLMDKLNKQIGPEFLTVYDDGTIPGGLASSTYDGEGVPKKRFVVIEKGVLKTYLHNSYTANKAKVENNACAVRSYYSVPGIAPSNIQITPGDWKFEELLEETKEGILIKRGGIYPDPVTGSISTSIDFGLKVERGEIKYPVKGALIGGNALEMLENIVGISKEYREIKGSIYPAIKIKNVKVSGSA